MPTPKQDDPTPPSGAPADSGGFDAAALESAIGRVLEAKLKERQPAGDPPPAAPASSSAPPASSSAPPASSAPADLAAMIDRAVSSALSQRDEQDALAVLADEVADIRRAMTSGGAKRRRGWGSYLLGPGITRD